MKIELDIVECASLLERQRIILDDISPSSNTNNALEESSFEENKDDNTKENSLKKGRYCIVDMTSSDDIADLYHVFLALGVHVVTPNKKCNSGPTARDQKCRGLSSMSWSTASWFYEATIGAGLPIISTLRNLTSSGDEVYQIKGVFSGTMSYLFNTYDGSLPFSEVVKQPRSSDIPNQTVERARCRGESGHCSAKVGWLDVRRKDVDSIFSAGRFKVAPRSLMKSLVQCTIPPSRKNLRTRKRGEMFCDFVEAPIYERWN